MPHGPSYHLTQMIAGLAGELAIAKAQIEALEAELAALKASPPPADTSEGNR